MPFYVSYACNEAYKIQTMVSMISLCRNFGEDELTILLIEDRMAESSLRDMRMLAKACKRRLIIFSLRKLLGGLYLEGGSRHPRTVYAKLFLADVCQAEKILYLDSDTVVLAPLVPLMHMKMENIYAAGVKMPYAAKKKASVGLTLKEPYLCDGILLINLEKWRKDHITEKCVSYIRQCGGHPPMLSEGTVNHVLHGFVKVLPPEYNLMSGMLMWSADQLSSLYGVEDYYSERELAHARAHPVIIHYLDELYIRPWYQNSDHPYRKYYREYLRMIKKMHISKADGTNRKEEKRKKEKRKKEECKKEEWQGSKIRRKKRMYSKYGTLRKRTRILRMMNRILPFWIFSKIYRTVKG